MPQPHSLEISISSKGEVKAEFQYRDYVPDLIGRFPLDVQRRAMRLFWWPNAYERKLKKGAKDLPRWAVETLRQHILHERAEAIMARRRRIKEQRRIREATTQAQLTTRQRLPESVLEPRPEALAHTPPTPRTTVPKPRERSHLAAETALDTPVPPTLSLTEQLAREHGVAPAWPLTERRLRDWDRGR